MQYGGLILNDMTGAPGVSVSFFVQGCPHRCHGCHNPETWDFDGGKEFTVDVLDKICEGLTANGVQRNFCLMGGEPLCQQNIFLSNLIVKTVKEKVPKAKIYIWTGYIFEDLIERNDKPVMDLLNAADVLIDGPYQEENRNTTLSMRGSSNQRIIDLTVALKNDII
jgi:anaerobic ribonucleoside-triphosphate reductase activating protein